VIGLAMKLGLAAPLPFLIHPSVPHPPPPPPGVVVVASPIASGAYRAPGEAASHVAVPPVPTTTTTTTTTTVYSGLECVVTLSAPDGTTMTYSPGPAVDGSCSVGTPEPVRSVS
jgi:hypothetical protein